MEQIGIALATYNGAMYINEMLNSILEQDYQNFIVHVCDDGSTDDTVQVIKQHELYKTYNKIVIHEMEEASEHVKIFKGLFLIVKRIILHYVIKMILGQK